MTTNPKTPPTRRRVPLELTAEDYQALRAWAVRNGFQELTPAIRWGLRQLGALQPLSVGEVPPEKREA